MKESYSSTTAYHSIDEIRARKAMLEKDIQADEVKIGQNGTRFLRNLRLCQKPPLLHNVCSAS